MNKFHPEPDDVKNLLTTLNTIAEECNPNVYGLPLGGDWYYIMVQAVEKFAYKVAQQAIYQNQTGISPFTVIRK